MFYKLLISIFLVSLVKGAFIQDLLNQFQNDDSTSYVTMVTTVQPAPGPTVSTSVVGNAATSLVNTSPTSAVTRPTSVASVNVGSDNSGGFFSSLLNSLFGTNGNNSGNGNTNNGAASTQSAQQTTSSKTTNTIQTFLSNIIIESDVVSSTIPNTLSSTTSASEMQPGFSAWHDISTSGTGSSTSSTSESYESGSSGSGSSNQGVSKAIAAAQGAKGITYSPYTKGGACKTTGEVEYDISKLKSFGLIRLYSTDCNGVANVLSSMSSAQKLFLGIYEIDTNTITSGLSTIKSAVESSSRGWSAVHTISVGNERVNDGKSSVSDLSAALQTTRQWLKSNAPNYSGYVVTVDTLVATVSNTGLCDISDYLAVNCHPYWDGGVQPSNSGPWLQDQISNLQNACGSSKSILITETGWPTKGDTNGDCVPSLNNQIAAIQSINSVLQDQVFMFTMYNDYWKDPGPKAVEQDWGIYGDPAA